MGSACSRLKSFLGGRRPRTKCFLGRPVPILHGGRAFEVATPAVGSGSVPCEVEADRGGLSPVLGGSFFFPGVGQGQLSDSEADGPPCEDGPWAAGPPEVGADDGVRAEGRLADGPPEAWYVPGAELVTGCGGLSVGMGGQAA